MKFIPENIYTKSLNSYTDIGYLNAENKAVRATEFEMINKPVKNLKIMYFQYSSTEVPKVNIQDPRGFNFFIRIKEFEEILKSVEIKDGEIQDEMVISINTASWYPCLTKVDSPEYYELINKDVSKIVPIKDLIFGATYVYQGQFYTYLGRYKFRKDRHSNMKLRYIFVNEKGSFINLNSISKYLFLVDSNVNPNAENLKKYILTNEEFYDEDEIVRYHYYFKEGELTKENWEDHYNLRVNSEYVRVHKKYGEIPDGIYTIVDVANGNVLDVQDRVFWNEILYKLGPNTDLSVLSKEKVL